MIERREPQRNRIGAALLEVAKSLGTETHFHEGMKAMFDASLKLGLGAHDLSATVNAFEANTEL
ncbi:MAG: hypothetical protein JXR14_14190 [Paracoccaceae bacterium]